MQSIFYETHTNCNKDCIIVLSTAVTAVALVKFSNDPCKTTIPILKDVKFASKIKIENFGLSLTPMCVNTVYSVLATINHCTSKSSQ